MIEQKSLSNFTATSFAQAIALISQLVSIKILTTHLSLAEFGLYSLIIIVPSLVLPIIFSEVISGVVRYFFEEDKYKLYFNAIVYLCLAFLTLLIVLYFLKDPATSLLNYFEVSVSSEILFLALVSHFFIYLHSLTGAFFKINYQGKLLIFQSILLNIPKTVALLLLINNFDNKIYAAFFILAISHSVSYFLTSFTTLLKSGFEVQVPLIKKILAYSFWLIPGSYFGTIISSSDRIIIKMLTNVNNVGIYSIGYKIGDLIRQFFIVSFASVLAPVKYNTKVNQKNYQIKMNDLFIIYTSVGLILALLANSVTNLVILAIANKEFLSANYVVPFILLAHIIWGLNDFLNTGYLLKNKTKITSLILLIGAAINLILNFSLIPKLGIVGACLSTLIAYLISLPISYYCSKKSHELRFYTLKPTILVMVFCLFAGLQTYLNNYMDLSHAIGINLLLSFVFIMICYILLTKEQKQRLNKFKLPKAGNS